MRAVPIAILLALLHAPAAGAAGWSTTRAFGAGVPDATPRVAISRGGRALLAYWSERGLVVRFGDGRGRFGAPRPVSRVRRGYAVAPGALAYETNAGIRVAVRDGNRLRDRLVATGTGSEINGVAIAVDPRGGWVVAERQFTRGRRTYRVRALSLDADGRRVGAVQDLGPGSFGIDARPTSALAVLPDGRALLVFQREAAQGVDPQPAVIAERPHGGAFAAPVALGTQYGDPRVTVAGDQAVVSATETTSCGDAGCSGHPRAFSSTGALLAAPRLEHPNRAFGPWAVRRSLIFQLKDGVQAFSREAPVKAVTFNVDGSLGRLQTLTEERATEPIGLALDGGGTFALWATRERLGAVLAGADGAFHRIAAPSGPPPQRYHYNSTNRDARSGGRYVIVGWDRGHSVHVSVRRF